MAKKIVVFTLIPFVLLVAYVMHHNFNSVLDMQSANQFNSILELESVCKKDEPNKRFKLDKFDRIHIAICGGNFFWAGQVYDVSKFHK